MCPSISRQNTRKTALTFTYRKPSSESATKRTTIQPSKSSLTAERQSRFTSATSTPGQRTKTAIYISNSLASSHRRSHPIWRSPPLSLRSILQSSKWRLSLRSVTWQSLASIIGASGLVGRFCCRSCRKEARQQILRHKCVDFFCNWNS